MITGNPGCQATRQAILGYPTLAKASLTKGNPGYQTTRQAKVV